MEKRRLLKCFAICEQMKKERLIRQIRLQSAALADELSGEGVGFEQIVNLSEEQMKRLFQLY